MAPVRRLVELALLAASMAALLAMSPRVTAPELGIAPFRIGAVYPLTGPQGTGGQEELAGVQAAVTLINASGGVRGRPVQLDVHDAPDAAAGVAAVDALASAGITAIVGSYSSVISVAASAEANKRGVIWWETGAVADDVTSRKLPNVFRTVATGSSLGRMSARFTDEVLLPHWKMAPASARIDIVYENDVYGQSVAAGAQAEALARGLHVTKSIAYDPAAFSPANIAATLKRDNADVLWDASYLNDGIAIWRAVVAANLHLKGAIGTSSAFCLPDFGQQLGPLADGLFASDKPDATISPDSLLPDAAALLARAQQTYQAQQGTAMGISGLAGFVGAWALLHDVLPSSATGEPAAIRAAALHVNLPYGSEINGAGLQFAPPGSADTGQNTRAASVVWQWQSGQETIVYPAPYVQGPPRVQTVPA